MENNLIDLREFEKYKKYHNALKSLAYPSGQRKTIIETYELYLKIRDQKQLSRNDCFIFLDGIISCLTCNINSVSWLIPCLKIKSFFLREDKFAKKYFDLLHLLPENVNLDQNTSLQDIIEAIISKEGTISIEGKSFSKQDSLRLYAGLFDCPTICGGLIISICKKYEDNIKRAYVFAEARDMMKCIRLFRKNRKIKIHNLSYLQKVKLNNMFLNEDIELINDFFEWSLRDHQEELDTILITKKIRELSILSPENHSSIVEVLLELKNFIFKNYYLTEFEKNILDSFFEYYQMQENSNLCEDTNPIKNEETHVNECYDTNSNDTDKDFGIPNNLFEKPIDYEAWNGYLCEKFHNVSNIRKLIQFLTTKKFISSDQNIINTYIYRITGRNKPDNLVEKIIWNESTINKKTHEISYVPYNLFCLHKFLTTEKNGVANYDKLKEYIDVPNDPNYETESGNIAARGKEVRIFLESIN